MGSGAPQWLRAALDDALVRLGASASSKEREAEVTRVLDYWEGRVGPISGFRFLSSMFEKLDLMDGLASDSDLLHVAMAYRGSGDSAGWSDLPILEVPEGEPVGLADDDAANLRRLGIDDDVVERIHSLLKQLHRYTPNDEDLDAKILIDADMSVLAASPQAYKQLMTAIFEVLEAESDDLMERRRLFAQRLLDRPRIYHTPIAADWEKTARQNLEAELASLTARAKPEGVFDEPSAESPRENESDVKMRDEGTQKPARAAGEAPKSPVVVVRPASPKRTPISAESEEAAPKQRRAPLVKALADLSDGDGRGGDGQDDFSATASTLESAADLIERHRRKQSSK